jgi:hypothetical protein
MIGGGMDGGAIIGFSNLFWDCVGVEGKNTLKADQSLNIKCINNEN